MDIKKEIKKDLLKIKEKISVGERTILSEKTGYSYMTVVRYLQGFSLSDRTAIAIIKAYKEVEEEKQKLL